VKWGKHWGEAPGVLGVGIRSIVLEKRGVMGKGLGLRSGSVLEKRG